MADRFSNRTSYGLVGLTLVAGLLAIAATLVYFGGLANHRRELLAETYYEHSVAGLSAGSAVTFRGVQVGEVKRISFVGAEYDDAVGADREKIFILFSVDRELLGFDNSGNAELVLKRLIGRGLRATVKANGITGLSKLELGISTASASPAPISWRPVRYCVPPEPSIFENFADAATVLVNQLKQLDVNAIWSKVANIADRSGELVDSAAGLVVSQRGNVESLIESLSRSAFSLERLLGELADNPSLMIRNREPLVLEETK